MNEVLTLDSLIQAVAANLIPFIILIIAVAIANKSKKGFWVLFILGCALRGITYFTYYNLAHDYKSPYYSTYNQAILRYTLFVFLLIAIPLYIIGKERSKKCVIKSKKKANDSITDMQRAGPIADESNIQVAKQQLFHNEVHETFNKSAGDPQTSPQINKGRRDAEKSVLTGNRYNVTLPNGSTIWLNEDAFQRYEKGELDLTAPPSPERIKRLEEAKRLHRAQMMNAAESSQNENGVVNRAQYGVASQRSDTSCIICKNCGATIIQTDAVYCPRCGQRLSRLVSDTAIPDGLAQTAAAESENTIPDSAPNTAYTIYEENEEKKNSKSAPPKESGKKRAGMIVGFIIVALLVGLAVWLLTIRSNEFFDSIEETKSAENDAVEYVDRAKSLIAKKSYYSAYKTIKECQKKYPDSNAASECNRLVSQIESVVKNNEPQNGTTLERTFQYMGSSILRVTAKSGPATVTIRDKMDPSAYATMYVRKGQTAELTVTGGTYRVDYKTGYLWFDDKIGFGDYCERGSFQDDFVFKIINNGTWSSSTVREITI